MLNFARLYRFSVPRAADVEELRTTDFGFLANVKCQLLSLGQSLLFKERVLFLVTLLVYILNV